jgi:hypothetical protein
LFLLIIIIRKRARQATRCPAGGGRQHRIDIIAKQANKVGMAGVASRGNEPLFAVRAAANIHHELQGVVGNIPTLYATPRQLTGLGLVETII